MHPEKQTLESDARSGGGRGGGGASRDLDGDQLRCATVMQGGSKNLRRARVTYILGILIYWESTSVNRRHPYAAVVRQLGVRCIVSPQLQGLPFVEFQFSGLYITGLCLHHGIP